MTLGFLPAAASLGLQVTLFTDAPDSHRHAYAVWPCAPVEIVGCDVRNFHELLSAMTRLQRPGAVFSNSDHLQAQVALAATYFGLPAKDWRAALQAKNKALMRRVLTDRGFDTVAVAELSAGESPDLLARRPLPYPLVVKPREGVASEDVFLIRDAGELIARSRDIQSRRRGDALVVEKFLSGELRTLETLGDSRSVHVLGGFRTTVSAPPYFVEERLEWAPDLPSAVRKALFDQLQALGVGFGACHTEFISTDSGPQLVEVNYRLIGDQCDLLLADLLRVPLFEQVLRVHLGHLLVPDKPRSLVEHACAEYVLADRPGELLQAPRQVVLQMGQTRVWYHPLRALGDRIALCHTNRDYLGVIRAIGPDRCQVEAAVAKFRASNRWDVRP